MINNHFTDDDIIVYGPPDVPPDIAADVIWCVSKVCGFIGQSFLAVSKATSK